MDTTTTGATTLTRFGIRGATTVGSEGNTDDETVRTLTVVDGAGSDQDVSTMTDTDPNAWKQRAACAGNQQPDIFFPKRNAGRENPTRDASITIARKFCNHCPVRRECAQAALDNKEYYGVWAGVYLSGTRTGPLMHQLKLCAADINYRPKRDTPQKPKAVIELELTERREKVQALINQGLSVALVAEKVGASVRSVMRDCKLLKQQGLLTVDRRTYGQSSKQPGIIVQDLIRKGHSNHEIAARTGFTQRMVRAHRERVNREDSNNNQEISA